MVKGKHAKGLVLDHARQRFPKSIPGTHFPLDVHQRLWRKGHNARENRTTGSDRSKRDYLPQGFFKLYYAPGPQ